uniref:C-type lectin domain-containing protein n=1 Tax=Parascaris univalens TaxID=6257 RepID=A0A915AQY5_PARUN
ITITISLYVSNANFYDTVIPMPLRNKEENIAENRGARIDKHLRLITMLALMSQGWMLYELHWYRLFEIELQWIQAENYCRNVGGTLVSINDPAENDFVHKLRKKNNIWIGLNKLNDSLGIYKWSDGQEASYLNWDSTQPNEPFVDCTYMKYDERHLGTWYDYGCHSRLPMYFVCELYI